MPNCYTQFSFEIEANKEQADWWVEHMPDPEDEDADEVCSFEVRKDSIWFYSEENADMEALSQLCKQFLMEFGDNRAITWEYASTTSKPVLEGFGGGWFVVTKDEVFAGSTRDAMTDKVTELFGELKD